MERAKDSYPREGAAIKAAAVEDDPAMKRAKINPAGEPASQARRECDLNRVNDLEKSGREGR